MKNIALVFILLICTEVSKAQIKEVKADSVRISGSAQEEEEEIFSKTEQESSFPGGAKAYQSFLIKNWNPSVPGDNHAPPGSYNVVILFVVKRTGEISNIKAITNYGYGMEQEAIRLIKLFPNWIPAKQNGFAVNAYRRLSFLYEIQ